MFKSILTIGCGMMVLLFLPIRSWSMEDMEDRFVDPDISTSQTIFIDVKEVSLVDVLKIISKQSGLSFIAAHDVQDTKITLYLNKVPLNQALHMILDANNLTYEMQGDSGVFVVKTKEITEKTKITKVYQLKYATVSSSKLNSTIFSSSSSSSSASSASSSSGSSASPSSSGSSSSTGGAASSSSASGGLEQAVQDALSPDGKIIEDTRTNSLIITDVPSQFPIIESTIAKLDVPVPQVLIEVEMLDVSKAAMDQLGISYGANPISFTGAQKAVNYPFSRSTALASNLQTGGSSSSSSSTNAFLPGEFSATGLTAELNFLMTKTDARTLARPRILTLNNQTAQIQISTDQAISVEESTTTASSTVSSTGETVERYTTGVILKVTPQANLSTREITMAVSPEVIDVIASEVQQSGSGATPIYDPVTRSSDSILNLKDGQSMVIGGLMDNTSSNTSIKLPILGDLPVVGALFRSKTTQKAERELIIFLTPHIIDDTNQMAMVEKDSSTSSSTPANTPQRTQDIDSSLNNLDLQ